MNSDVADLVERILGSMDPIDILDVLDLPSYTLVDLLLEEILANRESFELYLEEVA